MDHHSGEFETDDGLSIYTESWLPNHTPRAIVVIVHGYGEHIGRYMHVANEFEAHGYAVYGLDHRGHGNSEGLRVHVDRFEQFVQDLKRYIEQIKEEQPNRPIFLYGHSMGSAIALAYALQYPQDIAGLIISGSALTADEEVPALVVKLSKLLSRLIPKVHLQPLDANLISRDADVVAAYNSDPLVVRKPFRIRLGAELLRTVQDIRQRLHELKMPILIVHGSADQLTPVSGAHVLYEQAGTDDKTLKVYEGLYHEVHNEPEQEQVLADIVDWLDAHTEDPPNDDEEL